MFADRPVLRTRISGTEHTPEHATENARAFVELGKAVADTFGRDYDELKFIDDDHYFIIEENGELNNYPVITDSSNMEYSVADLNGEIDSRWRTGMRLSEFEDVLEGVVESDDVALHGVSRATNYRMESSTPAGMMEGFVGPKRVPTDYGDAIIPLATKDNDVKVLLTGAPNSGAAIKNSLLERGIVKAKSVLSDKNSEEIMIEENQSDQEPYAELTFIEGSEYEDGMEDVTEEELQAVADNTSGFEVELK